MNQDHLESHIMIKATLGSSVSLLGAVSARVEELDQWVRVMSGLVGLIVGLLTLVFVIGPKACKQLRQWRLKPKNHKT